MARPVVPKGVRGQQRRGLVQMQQAVRDAFGLRTNDCELAVPMLVGAAQLMGSGDRLVQPVDPDKQPAVVKEWHRLHEEFGRHRDTILNRCVKKR